LLTAVFDAYGNSLRLRYDGASLVGFTDSAGREVRVRRLQPHGRIQAFEVQNGANGGFVAYRSYRYDDRGDLIAALDGYGSATRFSYDDDHYLLAQQTPEGTTTRYRYDRQGRCCETWCEPTAGDLALDQTAPELLADGTTPARGFLHCKIDRTDDYVEVITSRSVRRYFLRGGVVEKAVFASGVHDSEYDALGNLVRYVDPIEAEWIWRYDERGRRTFERGPLGHVCEWSYDERGHLIRTVYPTTVIDYVRNDQGDLELASDVMGPLVMYQRDARGLILSARTPAGMTLMSYDSMGNRVLVREPNGAERRLEYDYLGQLVGIIDESGHATRYQYGSGRELLSIVQADGSKLEYRYDRDGHLSAIYSPQGPYELRWGGYEVVHELKRPNGSSLRFRYDREGALCRVLDDANQTHVLKRDQEGRVIEEQTFGGRQVRYRLDALGRVIRVEDDQRQVTQIEYDALGRIIQRTLPDDTLESFSYDWNGRVLSGHSGGVECRFEYDVRGRKVLESQLYAGDTQHVAGTYGDTERTLLQTSRGYEQHIAYTAMLLPAEVRLPGLQAPIRLTWDGSDHEIERQLPGGAIVHVTYDALGRLTHRELSTSHGVHLGQPEWVGKRPGLRLEQDLSYLPGTTLPQRIDDSLRGPVDMTHDPLGQILSCTGAGLPGEHFSYESLDNLFDGSIARDYAPGGRLVRRGTTEYHYDGGHRLIEKRMTDQDGARAVWRYEWNAAGLMIASVSPEGARTEHVYDAFARRVEKRRLRDSVVVDCVRYVWDGAVPVHELRAGVDGAGHPVVNERTYAYLGSNPAPFAHRDSAINGSRHDSEWVYYLNDNTGRAQALYDGNGTILATYAEKAFGRMEPLLGTTPTVSTSARFFCHWEDVETGLFYNRYRFYDPDTGRYLSPEPMGLEGGLSAFGYAYNRPFDYFDPDGRLGMWAGGSGVPPRGSSSTEGIMSADVNLHPVVTGALANPSLANSYGSPRSPAACGEPRHLSDFLRSREPPPIDPNDHDRVRRELQDYKVQATQANNSVKRAPCANCSQMFGNLMAKYGAPDQQNIGTGGTAWNSLPQNFTNFTPPPAGAAGQGPNGQAWTSYSQALANYVPPP
jgi:RHS repeat-associated protein